MTRLFACLLLVSALAAQTTADPRNLAKGRFLVSIRDLPDPNFARTVVLLTDYSEKGAAGLVINRRTRITVAEAFEGAKGNEDLVYSGGPVNRRGLLALHRTKTAAADSQLVFGDVYLVTSAVSLGAALKDAKRDCVRLFLGYSGWSPGQLEREVELGTWHILRATVDAVFAADPAGVWELLIQRLERIIARGFSPAAHRPM